MRRLRVCCGESGSRFVDIIGDYKGIYFRERAG
jgi:hypothetical protein